MARWLAIPLALMMAGFFALMSQAIISIKLADLRIQVARGRLFNYELSSEVLKERFKSLTAGESDFRSELQKNVMESAIMNAANPEELSLTPVQLAGLAAVNAVRMASLKPFLRLSQDQEQLALVKLAFLFERNRRFDAAAEKYQSVIPDLAGSAPDLHGFSLLHVGYCLAVSGKRAEARTALERVRRDHPGTHFAETAAVLLRLLEENERRASEIEGRELSPLEKARAFFAARLYDQAAGAFEALRPLSPMDEYRFRRSQEETGKVQPAIQGYRAIIQENRDPQAVREANRRLLLIGHFYGGDRETRQFAENTARQIGDTAVVSEVQSAAAEQRSAVVLQEIYQSNNPDLGALRNEAAEQIQDAREQAAAAEVQEPSPPDLNGYLALRDPPNPPGFDLDLTGGLQSMAAIREPPPVSLTPAIAVRTRDGRLLLGEAIRFENGRAVFQADFSTQAPASEFSVVQCSDEQGDLSVLLQDGRRLRIKRLEFSTAGVRLMGGATEDELLELSALREVRASLP
ncbi:MAG: tetratricopeptide repeat protein [Leptospirales bacterium]|nr:tetratricopeptide repeat protein [Leptospirales bacterium]